MKKKRSGASLETVKNRAGATFVIHWTIGLIMFFGHPLVNSVWYAFNNVRIEPGKIVTEFVGIRHFYTILQEDPKYLNHLRDSLGMLFYSLPIIIALSLILAVILNQKFYGRTVFRAIFFIPVIMSTSVVMNLLNSDFITLPLFSSGEAGAGIIDYRGIIANLDIPDTFSPILTFLLSNTISLIWSCGVQTILFLAGLQSIPSSLYEVSKIEGANKWEEFWLITVPSLRNILSLVIIYTMIDLFADMKNQVISTAYSLMISQNFGESSAMLWFYFAIVIVVISAVYAAYQRFCVKKWE